MQNTFFMCWGLRDGTGKVTQFFKCYSEQTVIFISIFFLYRALFGIESEIIEETQTCEIADRSV